MKTYASFLVPVVLWVLAFVCALFPFNALSLEFFGACVTLTYLWAFIVLAKSVDTGWIVPKAPVLLCAGLFWLLTIASIFWSDIKPVTLMSICFFSVMPVTFLVGAVQGNERHFRAVAIALAPVFFGLGIWAVIQFVFLRDYFFGQARHPLADPSSLGALFSLALFCALGWLVQGKNRKHKMAAWLLSVSLFAGIVATAARGPAFALIPGLILFTVLLWPQVKRVKYYALTIMVAVIALMGLLSDTGPYVDGLGARMLNTAMLKDADVSNHRGELWSSTWHMIKDHPVTGTGFGTYFFYLPEYKDPAYTAAAYHAHNDPLEFWAELGFFGPLLFYAFVIAAAIRTFSALKKLEPEQIKKRVIVTAIFCALLSAVVQSHVNFSLYNLSILMGTGFLLSVWFFYTAKVAGGRTVLLQMPDAAPKIVNVVVLALPFLMLGGLFLSVVGGEHYTNKARDALFEGRMEDFANNINKAGHASLGMNYRSYILAVNVPLTMLEMGKDTLDTAAKQKLYEQAEDYMRIVMSINPRDASARYYLARAQELAGADAVPADEKPPEELYKEALRLDPMLLGARLALYDLYKKEGRSNQDLLAVLEPASDMYFITTLAMTYYETLARQYLEGGNYVKANEVMAKMVQFKKRSDSSLKHVQTSLPQALLSKDPLQ